MPSDDFSVFASPFVIAHQDWMAARIHRQARIRSDWRSAACGLIEPIYIGSPPRYRHADNINAMVGWLDRRDSQQPWSRALATGGKVAAVLPVESLYYRSHAPTIWTS